MADSFKLVQAQKFQLAGSGISLSDTSMTLKSFTDPNETALAMTDFGSIGYGTLEPGTSRQEIISFTGVTQNGDGTATITGLTRGLKFKDPYDQDTALRKSHAGNAVFILTNNPQVYAQISGKTNDETISGLWDFTTSPTVPTPTTNTQAANKSYVDGVAIAGAPDSSTSTKGIVKTSVAPASAANPIAVGDNDPRVPTSDEKAAMVGTSGTPGSGNKYVTDADTATAATASKVARRLAGGNITVVTESQSNNSTNAASTAYVDTAVSALAIQSMHSQPLSAVPASVAGSTTELYATTAYTGVSTSNAVYTSNGYSGGNAVIYRYTKRSNGSLSITHTTAITNHSPGNAVTIAVVGSYLYALTSNGGSPALTRFSASDLTGQTTMTVSGTALTINTNLFSDGTNLYNIYSAGSAKKYTISGTTATSSSDTSFTNMTTVGGAWCDGTSVYQIDAASGVSYKWALTGGARTTGTTFYLAEMINTSGTVSTGGGIFKDSSNSSEIYVTVFSKTTTGFIGVGRIIPITTF